MEAVKQLEKRNRAHDRGLREHTGRERLILSFSLLPFTLLESEGRRREREEVRARKRDL
jgi:hypothetical protein